jgi:hypothetical protein
VTSLAAEGYKEIKRIKPKTRKNISGVWKLPICPCTNRKGTKMEIAPTMDLNSQSFAWE